MAKRSQEQHDALIRTLRRLRMRLAMQIACRYGLHGLWVGATLALLWLIVSRLFPVVGDPLPPAAAVLGVSVVAGLVMALLRRPSLLETALEADRRLELRERITSSLELADLEGPMIDAVHADARRVLASRDAANTFRFGVPYVTRWAVVPVVLFGIAYVFLPEFDLLHQREREVEARQRDQAKAVSVERLKQAAEPLADAESADGELSDSLAELEGLTNDLQSGSINEKQALARIGNLAEKLRQHRNSIASSTPDLKLAGDKTKLSVTRELANALQQGRLGEAAQKAAEIQKKLAAATSEEEKKKLREDLKALSDVLQKSNSALGDALANALTDASTSIQNGNVDEAQASLEEMISQLNDTQSVMDQLNQMDSAMQQLAEWQSDNLGPSDFCRQCGAALSDCDAADGQCNAPGHKHSGICESCAAGNGWGSGSGLQGAGHGKGNQVGELPEVEVGLVPTKAKGAITKGKMIAEILQRSAPEAGEQPTVEYLEGAFVEVQQEAEQALIKEEIPPASKEYVRQYFGSLEPEADEPGR